ncbi:MAG: Enamine/imine deaminase [Alphaproteobacteria bacterium ADurb.Bin438]|nr:MAG: Enamine/imine deaminase [Alphaproteobacteria bacterium ADurb.Bin438]
MKKVILTPLAPQPIGPYSQAILVNDTLYCSGQIPLDCKSGLIVGENVKDQAELVCKNINAVLSEAGFSFENVVKATCFLKNMSDFKDFNEVYAKYFISNPARSCVAVKELPKDCLVEVEVIAVK